MEVVPAPHEEHNPANYIGAILNCFVDDSEGSEKRDKATAWLRRRKGIQQFYSHDMIESEDDKDGKHVNLAAWVKPEVARELRKRLLQLDGVIAVQLIWQPDFSMSSDVVEGEV